MQTVVFVQLGRAGDILTVLPAIKLYSEHFRTRLVVHSDYVSLVNRLDYVEPVRFCGDLTDVPAATRLARRCGDRVIVTQLEGNPDVVRSGNWQHQTWLRTGLPLMQFDTLPLELEPVTDIECDPDTVLWCGRGQTSPLGIADEVKRRLADQCRLVDVADVGAERLQDLLGLYRNARILVSIDTGPLHLGYACRIPTVAIVNDDQYCASPARSHWVARIPYSRATSCIDVAQPSPVLSI
jgi:hypothetical protein